MSFLMAITILYSMSRENIESYINIQYYEVGKVQII